MQKCNFSLLKFKTQKKKKKKKKKNTAQRSFSFLYNIMDLSFASSIPYQANIFGK